jgi:hypothetical protein
VLGAPWAVAKAVPSSASEGDARTGADRMTCACVRAWGCDDGTNTAADPYGRDGWVGGRGQGCPMAAGGEKDKHIREVWAGNLEEEMDHMRALIDSYPVLSMVRAHVSTPRRCADWAPDSVYARALACRVRDPRTPSSPAWWHARSATLRGKSFLTPAMAARAPGC